MIAQRFSKILTASGGDRETLLRNIFNTEVYQQLQENPRQTRRSLKKNINLTNAKCTTRYKS